MKLFETFPTPDPESTLGSLFLLNPEGLDGKAAKAAVSEIFMGSMKNGAMSAILNPDVEPLGYLFRSMWCAPSWAMERSEIIDTVGLTSDIISEARNARFLEDFGFEIDDKIGWFDFLKNLLV